MMMTALDTYGKIIREYVGDGFITLDTGQMCKCSVRAVQIADGKIMAGCHFSEDITSVLLCLDKENSITSVKGVTEDRAEFLLEGHLLWTNSNIHSTQDGSTIDIVFIASSLKFTKPQSGTVKLVKFGITNFEFLGNKFTKYPNGGGALDILSVNLGEKNVEIHEGQDHKIIMESVKAQKSIDVTSEVVIHLSSISDLDTVTPLVDTLCKLLSLARGTKINWIYYDCFDSYGERLSSFHKDSIVWQYAGLPLIDPRNPHDTASFVDQSFSNYLLHKDDLDIAIETYLDAKRDTGYLEIKALKAVVVLEFLKSRYAKQKNIDLRRGFRTVLETMFAELSIGINEVELKRFIKIRNSLVHEASFVTKEYWNEYSFLIGMLDKIFLKILNYNGTFLDITNKFNRLDTTQL